MKKYVYMFNEKTIISKNILGGKGSALCQMTKLGLPVPYGFTISTEACLEFYKNKEKISNKIIASIFSAITLLEKSTSKTFGSTTNPLLISVRSGARVSMPGMMDTILNLGLNDKIVSTLIEKGENARFLYDCYRRLIQMYGDVVLGYDKSFFETIITDIKKKKNVKYDSELETIDLALMIDKFKLVYVKNGDMFPQSVKDQLIGAVKAVFKSWNNERAIYYRKLNNIPDSWGTAVNVQQMVYGNLNDNSLTGVAFTRNPSTGENSLFGEFLVNAQGEDVVSGVRTPEHIDKLSILMPNIYKEFKKYSIILENYYKDMQDMEFTVENGKLYILQTRNGKRTSQAALRIAVELVNDKIITKTEAIKRISENDINNLLHPTLVESKLKDATLFATGLAASPGGAVGKIYFDAKTVEKMSKTEDVILVRNETSPEDIVGMNSAQGILTLRGGMTSHAAVVARSMGKPCVSGCENVVIDYDKKTIKCNNIIVKEGDYLSIDGTSGKVYLGNIEKENAPLNDYFKTFMKFCDNVDHLKIYANADKVEEVSFAINAGAKGIGLCRTEHMFFEEKRIHNFRKVILSVTQNERQKALNKILPYQISDFEKIFTIASGYPVTIRLLDPPLHEFLPKEKEEIDKLSMDLNISKKELLSRIDALKEFNPMLGQRGCRLLINYPQIVIMQTQAIVKAGINATKKGIKIYPEIMIPLISDAKEFMYLKDIIENTINEVFTEESEKFKIKIGTMIETPRSALTIDQITPHADFFSYGTNDLTQMTYGFSRDDSSSFINDYFEKKIITKDPFNHLDLEGVGKLIEYSSKEAKRVKNNIKLGVCGEQASADIEFFINNNFDYISCSSYKIYSSILKASQIKIAKDEEFVIK